MRTLADIFGYLVFVVGIMVAMAGCFGATLIGPAGGFVFWLGVIMIVVDWLIQSVASKKTCPHRAEEVKHKALKCKHCGHEFAAA